MKRLLMFTVTFTVMLNCCFFYAGCEENAQIPSVSAQCAVVVELKSGSIICGKSEHKKASMASTTKIMTALLLCELTNLDDEITATKEMVAVEGSSMGLKAGDRVHYRDLLYGMLLASGNDAANATAISISGSIEEFAELMNLRAQKIGMNNTHFVTPSGLDDAEHYSTAYDMALLACEAMRNGEFAEACASSSARLEYGNPPYKRTLYNHNKLLKMYDGCNGIKTGFTKKSGRCLVSSAKRDGKEVVVVTLNAPNDWSDHKTLLDYGISKLEIRRLSLPLLGKTSVVGGVNNYVKLTANAPETALRPSDFDRLKIKIIKQDVVFAPVNGSDLIGTIEWQLDGNVVAKTEITASESIFSKHDIDSSSFAFWIERMLLA